MFDAKKCCSVASHRMTFSRTFLSAIRALNGLQSNATVLAKLKLRSQRNPAVNVEETARFLEQTGVKISDLDRLKVIHVAGTKGKGSVCAMLETILRNNGLKTGFYSSPHLVHVRERIRINGIPISEEMFSSYFWPIYDKISESKHIDDSFPQMPAYFKFLTIMAFHIFLGEKIDVAVVEVGIGGAYDCTNVLRHPVVCGITTLDYDHMTVLGNTLEEIAWQKAGIMKPGTISVTTTQPQQCLNVLLDRSKELQCPLFLCPPFPTYEYYTSAEGSISNLKLGIAGHQQLGNASLALQLARLWFARNENPSYTPEADIQGNLIPVLKPHRVSHVESKALSSCRWPGRSQTLIRDSTTFYMDGAHTPKSMEACANWFRDVTSNCIGGGGDTVRILMFNRTAGRKPESLLHYLTDLDFDCAIFCPNMVHTSVDATSDQADMRMSHEQQMEVCEENRRAWLELNRNGDGLGVTNGLENGHAISASNGGVVVAVNGRNLQLVADVANGMDWRGHYPGASLQFRNFDHWSQANGVCPWTNKVTAVFPCISSALKWVDSLKMRLAGKQIQLLVTGSLHLVGGVLSIVDPDLKS